jgi:hypothetical protein
MSDCDDKCVCGEAIMNAFEITFRASATAGYEVPSNARNYSCMLCRFCCVTILLVPA